MKRALESHDESVSSQQILNSHFYTLISMRPLSQDFLFRARQIFRIINWPENWLDEKLQKSENPDFKNSHFLKIKEVKNSNFHLKIQN